MKQWLLLAGSFFFAAVLMSCGPPKFSDPEPTLPPAGVTPLPDAFEDLPHGRKAQPPLSVLRPTRQATLGPAPQHRERSARSFSRSTPTLAPSRHPTVAASADPSWQENMAREVYSGSGFAWVDPSWITDAMDSFPVSVSARGLWLSNPAGVLELHGLEPADSLGEWLKRTPEQHEEYQLARQGLVNTDLKNTMRQFSPEWEEVFGFGAWDVATMAETGEVVWAGFGLNRLTGELDPGGVEEKLLSLSYETETYAGQRYLAVPEGQSPDIQGPLRHKVNSNVRYVFPDAQVLLTAPNREGMEELLSVRAGLSPSLGQDPAFGDLVFTLSETFFVAVLSRKAPLEPGHESFRHYERPQEWESLGQWTAMSASFSHPSAEARIITVSLWYEDLADAQRGSEELSNRFVSFHPEVLKPVVFLQQFCLDHWKTTVVESPRGAVLSVSRQPLSGDLTHLVGSSLLNVLIEGTLAHLLS